MRIETFDPQATLEMTVWEHESVKQIVIMRLHLPPDQCAVARVHPQPIGTFMAVGPMENRYQIPVPWLITPPGHVQQRQRRHITWASLEASGVVIAGFCNRKALFHRDSPVRTPCFKHPADIDVRLIYALMAVRDKRFSPHRTAAFAPHPVHFSGALRNPDKGGVIWCARAFNPTIRSTWAPSPWSSPPTMKPNEKR